MGGITYRKSLQDLTPETSLPVLHWLYSAKCLGCSGLPFFLGSKGIGRRSWPCSGGIPVSLFFTIVPICYFPLTFYDTTTQLKYFIFL